MKFSTKLVFAFAARAAGSLGTFLFLMLSARYYGAEAAGLIFNTLAVGYSISILANLGLSRFTLDALPRMQNDEAQRELLIEKIQTIISLSSLVLFLCGAILYRDATSGHDLRGGWATGIPIGLMLAGCLSFLLSVADFLKSRGDAAHAIFYEVSGLPLLSTVGLLVNLVLDIHFPLHPVELLLISAILLVLFSLYSSPDLTWRPVQRFLRKSHVRSIGGFLLEYRRKLAVFFATGLLVMAGSRITGLIAPFLLTAAEAGFIAAVVGVASLGGTIISASQAYFAPRFSRVHECGDVEGLRQELFYSRIVCGVLFVPIAAFVFLVPNFVLGLFGEEISTYPSFLLVVAVGAQFFRCLTGCSEIFLSMVGHGKSELILIMVSLMVFLVLILSSSYDFLSGVVFAYSAMLVSRAFISLFASMLVVRSLQRE